MWQGRPRSKKATPGDTQAEQPGMELRPLWLHWAGPRTMGQQRRRLQEVPGWLQWCREHRRETTPTVSSAPTSALALPPFYCWSLEVAPRPPSFCSTTTNEDKGGDTAPAVTSPTCMRTARENILKGNSFPPGCLIEPIGGNICHPPQRTKMRRKWLVHPERRKSEILKARGRVLTKAGDPLLRAGRRKTG